MRNLLALGILAAAAASFGETPAAVTGWTVQSNLLPNATQMGGAAVVGQNLYMMGGNNTLVGDTADTYKLALDQFSGMANSVTAQAALPNSTYAYIYESVDATTHTAASNFGSIYIVGGGYNSGGPNRNNITMANTDTNGDIATWSESPAMPGGYDPELGAVTITGSQYLYGFGGDSQSGTPLTYNTVVYAPVNTDGSLGTIQSTLSLPDADGNSSNGTGWWFAAACAVDNYIVALPGISSTESNSDASNKVYVGTTNSSTGAVTAWTEQVGAPLPAALYNVGLVSVGNTVFAIGARLQGTGEGLTNVYRATFDSGTGTLGAWQTAFDAQLPDGVHYHSVVYSDYSKRLYVVGIRRTSDGLVSNEAYISSRLFAIPTPAAAEKDWSLYQ